MSRSPIRGGGFRTMGVAHHHNHGSASSRSREMAKRNILGVWKEDGTAGGSSRNIDNQSADSQIDGSNPDHVKMLIQDLETSKLQQIELLKTDLLRAKQELHGTHMAGMVKLPKAVRHMTVKDFNTTYKCSILQMLLQSDGVQMTGHKRPLPSMSSTLRAAPKGMPFVAPTPAPTQRYGALPPGTLLRTARRGEVLYSQNGSPVEQRGLGALVATVAKKRRGNSEAPIEEFEGAEFEINVGDGQVVRLNDPAGVDGLNSDLRATAASQLKVLQDQMNSLMAKLSN